MNESVVEQSALEYLAGLGFAVRPGAEFAPDHPNEERGEWGEAVLGGRLCNVMMSINPTLPPAAIDDGIRRLFLHDSPLLIANNKDCGFSSDSIGHIAADPRGHFCRVPPGDFERPREHNHLSC